MISPQRNSDCITKSFQISSEEEGWFLEFLLRMDGRMEWTDLLMRMEYPGSTVSDEQKIRNRLQQRAARMRESFVMVSWRDTAGDKNAVRDRVLSKLTPAQLAARGGLGTTRGITPGSVDGQGRIIPVPGRRGLGTGNAWTTITQGQYAQAQTAYADPLSAVSQQDYQAAFAGSSQQQQPSSYHVGVKTKLQHSRPSVVYPGFVSTQQLPSTPVYAGPSEFSQDLGWYASEEYGEEEYNYGVDEGNVSDEVEGSDEDQRSGESDESDQSDIYDEDEEYDSRTPLAGPNTGMDKLSARYCCGLQGSFSEDHIQTQLLREREISQARLGSGLQKDEAKLEQGLKKSREEISDNDEIEGIQSQRAKRMRTEEGSSGSSGHLFQAVRTGISKPQPSPWGEYNHYGGLAYTSRRSAARAAGSAVQRLHNDRRRRPAPKATRGEASVLSYHHQSDLATDDEDCIVYNVQTDSQQPPKLSEQGDGSGNGSFRANIDQTLSLHRSQQENTLASGNAYADARWRQTQSPSQPHQQLDTERHASSTQGQPLPSPSEATFSPNTVSLPRSGGWHIPPCRAYQQAIADTTPDDPFFSDELFNSMLNGQPDNNHVGSMYTYSQQEEIDEYHRRQLMPRPGPGKCSDDSVESEVSLSCFDVLDGSTRQVGGEELVVGDMAGWNAEWEAFVHGHDAEPLLRAHCRDEYLPEEDNVLEH